uniref:Uncharacterized protein n=1 Tax=Arundo donax TaxID=35708 RepID=A0A0A9EIJ5_ARUDO
MLAVASLLATAELPQCCLLSLRLALHTRRRRPAFGALCPPPPPPPTSTRRGQLPLHGPLRPSRAPHPDDTSSLGLLPPDLLPLLMSVLAVPAKSKATNPARC